MKKVAIVWRFPQAKEIMPNWRDGIRAALELLGERFETHWFLGEDTPPLHNFDFILQWDSSQNDFIPELRRLRPKKGLMLTTEFGLNTNNLFAYDVIFCEADPVLKAVRNAGVYGVKAFGTDTKFFKPSRKAKKYGAFYPATFSNWKRQDLFAYALGVEGLVLGTTQPDGKRHFAVCREQGVNIVTGYISPEDLLDYYKESEVVVVTGYEGSGRTVLQAMSMNIPVVVTSDNLKCVSYVKEAGEGFIADPTQASIREAYETALDTKVNTRKFIRANYSAEGYAETMAREIEYA